MSCFSCKDRRSFTLVELLVVVALLAILAAVVIMVLNPPELLKQARDSTRLADLETLNKALLLYQLENTSGYGNSNTVYVSIPDLAATSTSGTNCGSLGLPSLPSAWSYRCAASSTYRNVDSLGWLPVNFSSLSFGTPLGVLPVDPVNTTSSGNYYTYVSGGSWDLTTLFESDKYADKAVNDGDAYPGVYSLRTSASPLTPGIRDKGLVGYWKFDEGSGSTASDSSGSGNVGTFGSGVTWIDGKVNKALAFNGSGGVVAPDASTLRLPNDFTIIAWFNLAAPPGAADSRPIVGKLGTGFPLNYVLSVAYDPIRIYPSVYSSGGQAYSFTSNATINLNTWYFVALTRTTTDSGKLYLNGLLDKTGTFPSGTLAVNNDLLRIGESGGFVRYWNGLIDDVRIYNRALSAAEIAAIYNATK